MALSAVLLALWLIYRAQKRRAAREIPPPSAPEAIREDEGGLYEEARAEMEAETVPEEVAPAPPVEEVVPEEEMAPTPVEAPPPEGEVEAEEAAPIEEVESAVEVEEPQPVEEAPPEVDFFTRLRHGLARTKKSFVGRVDSLLGGARLDEDTFEELEEALVTADLGVKTAYKLLEKIQSEAGRGQLKEPGAARGLLQNEIKQILDAVEAPLDVETSKPYVIMVLGVNGVGKTTTIGKLAWRYRKQGKKVLVAAADTFRAAAIEQLAEWAKRAGANIVKHESGSDPGAVAFDAIKAAVARDVDVVIIDTAGRLHTRVPLMDELKKIKRVVGRELEGAPHETLLVLDAGTGQNAISQAETFNRTLEVTGIALTKLDGTAKGGVIVGISDLFGIPIRLIGIGERMDDLMDFEAAPFVEALF